MGKPSRKIPFHYGWIIVLAGMLAVFACIGLGRLALGMLLPSMGENLQLSYAQMGMISTGNFVGYLGSVLACGWLVRRLGSRTTASLGLLTVGCSMVLISSMDQYPAIFALYVLTGIGSGTANIPVMGLVAHWFGARSRGRASGLIVAGNGLAIMLSGTLIPMLNAEQGAAGWRQGWMLLGALVVLIALACAVLLRNRPEDMGLKPIGTDGSLAQSNDGSEKRSAPEASTALLALIGSIFFLFCFTYVIYATFIVTTLVDEMGFSEAAAGQLWIWVGFFALFSGPVLGALSDRIGRRRGLIAVFSMQTCAYLLVASQLSGGWIYLSITLYGFSAFSVPSIIVAALSDYLSKEKVTSSLGQVTFLASFGQIAGPGLAGQIAEASGSFAGSYLLAAGMTVAASVLALMLPESKKLFLIERVIQNNAQKGSV